MENHPFNNKVALLCSECGREIPEEETIRFGKTIVCANCKPLYIQKLKEGVIKSELKQANFGVRILALLIDTFAVIVLMLLETHLPMILLIYSINLWITFLFIILYYSFSLASTGATLGKQIFGLRVIKVDGSKLSFLRALARFFVQFLPIIIIAVILFIQAAKNYNSPPIMSEQVLGWVSNSCLLIFILTNLTALFDKQGRALHDRICGTRVVMK